jgi:penicillin-binding protein 1A
MNEIFLRFRRPPKPYQLVGLGVLLWLCAMLLLHQMLIDLPDIDKLENYTPPLITKIYDVHGDIITELFTERRTVIPLNEIPLNLQNAFLATEDEHFFSHWGVNPRGILRAFLVNLRHGRVVEGGSTITQQLSKVLFFTQEKTLSRKIREFLLALQLERHYSKEEIFQLYLNQIYFGSGAYGVEAAARTFFGKHVKDLSLAECAILAGLPRSPRSYSPLTNPQNAHRRRAWVLQRMRRSGFITPQEEAQANVVPINSTRTPVTPPAGAYFVEYLRQVLEPKYGENSLYQGGYSIYTTLDLKMQRAGEAAMNKALSQFDDQAAKDRAAQLALDKKNKKKQKLPPPPAASTATVKVQGALVAIDPRSGGIRALVGGREFKESQFNRVSQAQRQPGSSFKPFVWLAALEAGMTGATMVDDDRVAFYNDGRDWKLLESATDAYAIAQATAPFPSDQVWVPQDWDFKYFGPVTLRTGLAMSRNLVSIRLADHVTPKVVVEYAQRCGIKSALQPVLSVALGTEAVNLLELTASYCTFADGGIKSEPYGILKIEDKNGKTLEEYTPKQDVVLDAQTAYLMTDLLHAVVNEGTGRRALELGRPTAAKTGTNQDLRDLWFVGFTPELATGAWMGYDDFTSMGKKFTAASKVVPWWTDFMKEALKGTPARTFTVPDGIIFAKIDAQTGYLALPSCPKVVLQAFKRGTEPRDLCPVDHAAQPIAEKETEE